jgi:hypothetical protein
MTTAQPKPSADTPVTQKPKRPWGVAWVVLALATLIAIGWNARNYPDARVGNPDVKGAPRPVEPLFGFDHWVTFFETVAAIMAVVLVAGLVLAWRRYPAHPVLLMGIVGTIIIWQDPIANWATYWVGNPRMWHFPESWPLVSLSPVVEPFIMIGYVTFYLAPYFPAMWILRRLQATRPADSFVWRHPLICLGALIFIVGFIVDAFVEISLIRTGLFIYSHVVPFGSVFAGTTFQFPLVWESSLIAMVMTSAGVLLYRDDTGRTVAEKLAQRARVFPSRPALGTFLVMLVIVNAAYFAYLAGLAVIKWTHTATAVACPWPYSEAKLYDPHGFYEEASAPGPYSVGIWSTWMSAQPHGRPDVQPPTNGGPCGPAGAR